LDNEYSDGPGGLGGNDDAGQMSAWYVMASLGFYPLDPVSDQYILTSPLFNSYAVSLPNGKQFKAVIHRESAGSLYIARVLYNGKSYNKSYITYSMIKNGGSIAFFLSDAPDKKWGIKPTDRPASISN
jgi:putative alpha-1,2-mannosidase